MCFVITSKIHYSRNKRVLAEIKKHPRLELQVVVGGAALVEKTGVVVPELEADGFSIDAEYHMTLEGSSPMAMAKSAGIGLMEITSVFHRLAPDIVVVRGDRYEVLPVAVAAAYMNIPVAHIEGGDVTGSIDESIRHAITKLAHIHFPTNDESAQRIVRMGERPDFVFTVGSPELEVVVNNSFRISDRYVNSLGVGDVIKLNEPFLMVMQHSVTTEASEALDQIMETLHAVNDAEIPAIWFWPNLDAGSDLISKGIRMFREQHQPKHMRFLRYLPSEEFYALLQKTACLVGNSSAGFKEAALLGTPVVNIGSRQNGRFGKNRGKQIVLAKHDRADIQRAIQKQLKSGRYAPDKTMYRKDTARRIAETLSKVVLYTQKQFVDKLR